MADQQKFELSKNPEENWNNAVSQLFDAFKQCKNSEEFYRTYLIIRECLFEYFGKLNMSRNLTEIFRIGRSGGDADAKMQQDILQGFDIAMDDARIQLFGLQFRVSDSEFQNYVNEHNQLTRTAKVYNCPCCNTGYPIIKDIRLKICPVCGNKQ